LSQSPSQSSSLGPVSPSISYSNTSSAPILSTRPATSSAPSTPNKLVKRTASQRIPNQTSKLPSGIKAQIPTLRRPATSHQRSATLQQQYLIDGAQNFIKESLPRRDHLRRFASSRSIPSPRQETKWRLYFDPKSVKLTKEGPTAKRSITVSRSVDAPINRITPNSRHLPTLLMASSINACPKDEDQESCHTTDYDDDSVFLECSGLATPPDLPASPDIPSPIDERRPNHRPRRSFSIADMFSSGSSPSWIPRSRSVLYNKYGRKDVNGGKRHSSVPLYSMPNRVSVSAHAGPSSQRRSITDPLVFRRDSQTAHADGSPVDPFPPYSRSRNALSPLQSLNRLSGSDVDLSDAQPSSPRALFPDPLPSRRNSYYGGPIPPSSPPISTSRQTHRLSLVAPSDRASTLVGSDNENRAFGSGDDDDMDFQSETVFDSLRTGATGSSSGARGPRIETIFDESPPAELSKRKVVALQDLLPEGTFRDSGMHTWNGIAEEDENMSTPVRGRSQLLDDDFSTPVKAKSVVSTRKDFPSSPPEMPVPLSLGKLEWDAHYAERDNDQWSFDDEEDDEDDEDWSRCGDEAEISNRLSSPQSGHPLRPDYQGVLSDSTNRSRSRNHEYRERDARSNLFEWSEQTPVDKASKGSSRPKTVHGKQDPDGRGGRPPGRRAPSALHIRSQSVPVIPDSVGQREYGGMTARFGSLGLGSKGVSEDWNEDFEFDGFDGIPNGDGFENGEKRDSGFAMVVPQAIKERQASVLGHLGHVKEFALLVEGLKRLRTHAVAKRIRDGPSANLWDEADAIIALATLNDDDEELLPSRSPSSPSFGFDAFDDDFQPSPNAGRNRRKSVLLPDDDIFGGSSSGITAQPIAKQNSKSPPRPQGHSLSKSDRQDASSVARSLMETMHQRRTTSDPVLSTISANPQKKMPFDTTTLRDLVAHVSSLTRTLADVIRNADDAPPSPIRSPNLSATPPPNHFPPEPLSTSPPMNRPRLHEVNVATLSAAV
jgi:Septation protein etd1